MRKGWAAAWCAAASLLLFGKALAEEKERTVVFEMGGAGGWGLKRGDFSSGPDIGFEYTVIERWLEVEVTTTPAFSKGQVEFDTDFVFKKPFELTDRLEFLIGAGPLWLHKPEGDSVAAEAIVEFVYEAWPERHTAIFVEPSYAYDFGKGHEQPVGVTAGLHIGIQ
jgi:hypothetical protein